MEMTYTYLMGLICAILATGAIVVMAFSVERIASAVEKLTKKEGQ